MTLTTTAAPRARVLFAVLATLTLPRTALSQGEPVEPYLLGPGDVLSVWIGAGGAGEGSASFSQELHVADDGTIDVAYLGRLTVAGKATPAISTQIREGLKEKGIYVRPSVSVNVLEHGSQPVTVSGAVHSPLRLFLQGRTRLREVLAMAGGIDEEAAGQEIRVSRRDGPPETVRRDALFGGDAAAAKAANVRIRAHDAVHVGPKDRFCITGPVRSPSCYPLEENTSLLDALALAGDFEVDFQDRTHVWIWHEVGGETSRERVDLARIEAGELPPPTIKKDDTIVVPRERYWVTVSGTVVTPGRYPFSPGMTLSDAIAVAGGTETEFFGGNLKKVVLVRGDNRRDVNVLDIMRGASPDIDLQPGDRVFVEKRKV